MLAHGNSLSHALWFLMKTMQDIGFINRSYYFLEMIEINLSNN